MIALMVAVNGGLSNVYGVYSATVLIHIIGLIAVSLTVLFRKEPLKPAAPVPWHFYTGGAIGVATTLFNNLAFGKISITAIVALGLLGQTLMSLVVDQFGLFGMPVKTFNRAKLIGLLFVLSGIGFMLFGSSAAVLPVILSLLTGVSIVCSRSVNARLAQHTGVFVGTWYNYIVGLALAAVVLAIALLTGSETFSPVMPSNPWILTGGLLGVAVVAASSFCAVKMSSFLLTLILFVGQIFTGLVLDAAVTQSFSLPSLAGGLFATAGLCLNLWLDKEARTS